MAEADWSNLVRIDDSWVSKYLVDQGLNKSNKLVVRAYSVAFSGTKQELAGLVNFIADSIIHFVFSDSRIEEITKKGHHPYREALKILGDISPDRDGKYGELILFLLVESILKTPMIAHKLPILTNTNDQQKGGDGLFIGHYQGNSALLIGESKIWKSCSSAIDDCLDSMNRFHGEVSSTHKLSHELNVAKNTINENLSKEDLDFILESLDPSSDQFKNNIMVHPALIIYDEPEIQQIEKRCLNKNDGEFIMNVHMKSKINSLFSSISDKMSVSHPEIKPYYIDFFFIPMSSVKLFRRVLYYEMHGVEYRDK